MASPQDVAAQIAAWRERDFKSDAEFKAAMTAARAASASEELGIVVGVTARQALLDEVAMRLYTGMLSKAEAEFEAEFSGREACSVWAFKSAEVFLRARDQHLASKEGEQ